MNLAFLLFAIRLANIWVPAFGNRLQHISDLRYPSEIPTSQNVPKAYYTEIKVYPADERGKQSSSPALINNKVNLKTSTAYDQSAKYIQLYPVIYAPDVPEDHSFQQENNHDQKFEISRPSIYKQFTEIEKDTIQEVQPIGSFTLEFHQAFPQIYGKHNKHIHPQDGGQNNIGRKANCTYEHIHKRYRPGHKGTSSESDTYDHTTQNNLPTDVDNTEYFHSQPLESPSTDPQPPDYSKYHPQEARSRYTMKENSQESRKPEATPTAFFATTTIQPLVSISTSSFKQNSELNDPNKLLINQRSEHFNRIMNGDEFTTTARNFNGQDNEFSERIGRVHSNINSYYPRELNDQYNNFASHNIAMNPTSKRVMQSQPTKYSLIIYEPRDGLAEKLHNIGKDDDDSAVEDYEDNQTENYSQNSGSGNPATSKAFAFPLKVYANKQGPSTPRMISIGQPDFLYPPYVEAHFYRLPSSIIKDNSKVKGHHFNKTTSSQKLTYINQSPSMILFNEGRILQIEIPKLPFEQITNYVDKYKEKYSHSGTR